MNRVSRCLGLGLLLTCFAALSASAQDVYVTQPNNKIVKIDFETGETQTVVRDKGTRFHSVLARPAIGPSGLRLLASNGARGGDIRVYDADTGAGAVVTRFHRAHGIALSANGDLFASNRRRRGPDQVLYVPKLPGCADAIAGPFAPGCLAGGYGTPNLIDEDVEVDGVHIQTLADLRLARGGAPGLFAAGDLLVLVAKPAMVLSYSGDFASCNGMCDPTVVVAPGLIHHTPTGLEIAGQSLLIATKEGAILEVKDDAGPSVSELYTLPGQGARIAVGADDGALVAFAANPNKGGQVVEFDTTTGGFVANVKKGVKVPRGVGTEASNVVAAPAGEDIEIVLPQIKTTFTELTDPGLFNGECRYYPNPNAGCAASDSCPDIYLSDLDPTIPSSQDVLIPSYVQPFGLGSPGGPEQYLVCTVETNASIFDAYNALHKEETSIGYDPGCETFNADTANEARMFYAPIPGLDPTIAEGNQFIGITTNCGNSHFGRGWKFSYIMPISRDLRSTDDNIAFKQTALGDTFENAKDDILGECPALIPGGGPVPASAFAAGGLNPKDEHWAYVPEASGIFGTVGAGGNGLLLGGGMVEFQVKQAGFNHEFGTSDTGYGSEEIIIASTGGTPSGTTFAYAPTPDPYLFFFRNIANAGGLNGDAAYSDGFATDAKLDMAVYQNVHDPHEFALFFDDGGAGPDRDYTDTILLATGDVDLGTQCQLQNAIAHADHAVFDGQEIQYEDLVHHLEEILAIIDANPADFLDPEDRNTVGELRARTEAEIFQACKPLLEAFDLGDITHVPEVCPVQPEDAHGHHDE